MNVDDFKIGTRAKNSLKKAGYLTEEDFRNKTEDDLKIGGLGKTGLYELKEFLRFNFKISIPKLKKKVLDNSNECKKIVEYFLEGVQDINWPKELKTANQLLRIYGFAKLNMVPRPNGIYSLGLLASKWGGEYIAKNLPVAVLQERIEEKSAEKVEYPDVEYRPAEHKVKNIRDFLGVKK